MLSPELRIKYWFRFVRVIVRDEDCFQLSPSRRIYYSFSLSLSLFFACLLPSMPSRGMFCQESLTQFVCSLSLSFSLVLSSRDRLSGNDYFCQVPKRGKNLVQVFFFFLIFFTPAQYISNVCELMAFRTLSPLASFFSTHTPHWFRSAQGSITPYIDRCRCNISPRSAGAKNPFLAR